MASDNSYVDDLVLRAFSFNSLSFEVVFSDQRPLGQAIVLYKLAVDILCFLFCIASAFWQNYSLLGHKWLSISKKSPINIGDWCDIT